MKKRLLILAVAALFVDCKKHSTPTPVTSVGKASLTLPAQNSVCTTGTNQTATQSTVLFVWTGGALADSYDLTIKNLLTGTIATQHTTATQLATPLLLSTPYSWSVTSNASASGTTAVSDTWKFYNSGPGVITYAPFPAELLTPTYGQQLTAGNANFTWQGSSVNASTIASYDFYLGTTTTPSLNKSGITVSFLNTVNVSTGTTYYWKVVTRDMQGNTSDSGVSYFKVN